MSNAVSADAHTKFLQHVREEDCAFRIPVTISTPKGPLVLPEKDTQADQGSDLVVASRSLARQTGLEMKSLSKIGFGGMSMKTAEHRRIPLEHYVTLCVGAQDIEDEYLLHSS